MSIFPGGGSPPSPPPYVPPKPYVPPPPPPPPEPEGKKADKQEAKEVIARRAGRKGAILTGARGAKGGLGVIARPGAESDTKLG